MSRRKKRDCIPDFDYSQYISAGKRDKRYGRLFIGLLTSKAYLGLSLAAKNLLTVCISHCSSENNYYAINDYVKGEGLKEYEYHSGKGHFMLTDKQLRYYGVSSKNAWKWFDELEAAGFISTVQNNAHRRKPNIYQLSDKWKAIP